MFHAGTPDGVIEHIMNDMGKDGRLLICKAVSKVVYFGPSKTLECYVQECGRAGRDDTLSTCYLLFNGSIVSKS